MATIRQLLRGTQKVLPKTMERAPDGKNSPLQVLKITPFKGVNNLVVTSQQKRSGRWPKSERPSGRQGVYKQTIRFSLKDSGGTVGKDKPKLGRDKALVRCGCDAYYYYYWWHNKKVKAHEGSNFKRYNRKTDDRPEVNPGKIPGMCKHLVFLTKELKRKRKVQ